MTVPATPRRAGPFTGNGVTTSFPFTFKVFSDEDVRVVFATDGAETTLTLDDDYSITLNGDQDASPGGSITYPLSGALLASDETLTVAGATENTQELDLPGGGSFSPRALENALDRIVFQVQQVDEVADRALTLPVSATSGVSTELPVPVANNVIGWDAAGTALVNYEALPVGSANAANVVFTPAGTNAVVTTGQAKLRERISAFDFMTTAQIADAQAYTYALDLTTALQSAVSAAYAAGRDLYAPAGGYKVTGLTIPGTNNSAGKAHRFRIYGDGFGEAGVIALKNQGTFLYSVTDAPILNYTATVAGTGNGEIEIDHLALWGTSTTPVINLDTFYGLSSVHHCTVAQSGTGNGIQINWGATYDIHHNYVIGASYAANGLGAARTGVGVYIAQSTLSGGLQTVRQCTVAGWLTPIQLGVSGGAAYVYAPIVSKCEMSYCYKGVWLTDRCEGATVSQCYFEGQDAGYCVLDEGNYNKVKDSYFFFNPSSSAAYVMLSSTAAAKFGSRYEGNTFYLFNVANTVGLDITSNAVNGGPGKVASRNHFILSAGTAGVIGLRINGVDPRIEAASNDFQPAGAWTGTGTYAIRDLSTASDGTTGTAVYGLAQARSSAGALTVPRLARGAVNLAVEPTALANTSMTGTVLGLGELSVFTLTPTANITSITAFSAPNLPDKTFSIHVTATAFTVTFTQGTFMKLTGSANLVTGAAGCWISFQIKAGGVAWEAGRVVY